MLDVDTGVVIGWLGAVLVALGLLSAPVLLYRHAMKRQRNTWDVVDRVYVPTGGAYRGTVVDVSRSPGVPLAVRAASMWSLYMLVPAVVSVPCLLMGFAYAPAPSLVFGPVGIGIAALVVIAGRKLLRADRGAAKLGRTVAIVEIVHNVVVLGSVALASMSPKGHGDAWEAWSVEKLGIAAILYAAVSICHAVYLLGAVSVHEETTGAAQSADADEPEPVYASGR